MKKPANVAIWEKVLEMLPIETRYRLAARARAEKKTFEQTAFSILSEGVNTALFYSGGVNTLSTPVNK